MFKLKDKIELYFKVYDIIFFLEWYEKYMFEFIVIKLFKILDIIMWKVKFKDIIMYMYIYILGKIYG